MANHTKTITLTDLQQKILSNDLYNDVSDNAGVDAWIDGAINGKINNCWKRMQTEWTTKLMNDSSFTDPIPSNQADFVALVTARSDYKTRKQRDDASSIQDMDAGDTAKVRLYQSGGSAQTQIASGHSHFSGALIC